MPVRTDGTFVLDNPQRLKAIADETRSQILRILEREPASAKRLSELLDMSHGKVGHHVKVLRDAGLIEVVEERQVRALTERLYGLTYDRVEFDPTVGDRLEFAFAQAAREAAPASIQPFDPPANLVTVPMNRQTATELQERLMRLVAEFASSADESADEVFGISASIFLTETPQ